MSLYSEILPSDSAGVKWAKLQRSLRLACDNAGITYVLNGLLGDISPSDSEGVKWAKLGRWMGILSSGISPPPPPGAGSNKSDSVTNDTGNSTLTRTAPNMVYYLTVGGVARTSTIVLSTAGCIDGDSATVLASLPATANINLDFKNATSGGASLLPAINYAGQLLTTPGTAYMARIEFAFVTSAWVYAGSQNPA